MSIESDLQSIEAVEQYINNRVITNNQTKGIGGQERPNEKSQKVEKVEVRQNPQSHQIKGLGGN